MGGYYGIFYQNIDSALRTSEALNRHARTIQWEEKTKLECLFVHLPTRGFQSGQKTDMILLYS